MKRVSMLFQCPFCKGKTTFDLPKPGLIIPLLVRRQCSECESTFELNILKQRGNSQAVSLKVLNVYPSAEVLKYLEEKDKNEELS